MSIFVVAVSLLTSYLLGSLPTGYLIGRLAGTDIRKQGSGNPGATNVVRVLGKRFGYPVFVIDVLKGAMAVMLAVAIGERFRTSLSPDLLGIFAGICSVIGHSFPIWLGFKGGKGVATSVGVSLALMPAAAAIVLLVWVITFYLSRYVSVASMVAAIILPVAVALLSRVDKPALLCFAVGVAVLVIFRHRSNLVRLARGTEPRFSR